MQVRMSFRLVKYNDENTCFPLIILQLLTTFPSNLEVHTLALVE